MENNNIKILAIDDSFDNLVTIKALLKETFHEAQIFTATSGQKGIELAVAEDPDVILLDIVMPQMDGFETCKLLKKLDKTKDIPVVFVTAIQDDPQSHVLALESGGDAFLAKPIDESELVAQVRAMIKIKAAIQNKKNETERLKKMVEKQTSEISYMYSRTLELYNDLEKKTKKEIQQHNELIEVKQRFNMLLTASLDSPKDMIILAIDQNYHYIFFNQAHRDAMKYAYNQDISLGMSLLDKITSPTDVVNAKTNFDLAMTGVSHSTIQTYGDLNVSYYESFYNPIRDEKHNIIGATMFARNITDRIIAQKQLNEAKDKLELAMKSSGMGSWQFDIEKNVRVFDQQTCALLGIDPLTFTGTIDEFFSVIHPEDREKVKTALKNTIDRHEPYEPEYRVIHPDGSVHYIAAKGKLVLGTQEKQKLITGFIEDVTDNQLQQNELKEAKERFELLFSTSPDAAIITILSTGMIVGVNEGFTRLSGYSRDQVLAKSTLELNLYHNHSDRQDIIDVLKSHGSIQNKEFVFRRKDNTLFPGLISSNIITLAGAPHVYSTIRDISGYKRTDQKIREQSYLISSLFDNMPSAVAIYQVANEGESGKDYIVRLFNRAALQLENKTEDEVIGKSLTELRPNIDQYGLIPIFRRVWETGVSEIYPMKRYIDDQFARYYENRVFRLNTGEIVAVYDDVTERKNKEDNILYISNHDSLTGLYNRRYYVEAFETLQNPDHLPLGIMMIDVNGLKIINDAYGHDIGDQALKSVASVLKETFESKDILARIGGDEFAVLLPNTTLDIMQSYKDALRLSITKKPIMNVVLSIATGYEIMTNSDNTLDEMLKLAENHMYRHKIAEGVGVRNRTIQAILNTLNEKYEPEKIHSERVSLYCHQIGVAIQLRPDDLKELTMAGMFHDIGKISIPDAILEKPGKLTPEEFGIIKTHTEIGYQILRAADEYSDLAIHALSHHERWDGKGYPQGLIGNDIPLYSRIIGVADAFEAMTAERPYKKPITIEKAVEELKRCSGSQFDPEIVKVFTEQVLPKNHN